jgi:DNA-binding GntR family transcriptional regulator
MSSSSGAPGLSDSPSAADRAHAHIRSAIMRGELPPGSMLSENELAAVLAMSRTPVRAALARLQDEGWITIYAKRGALVRELTGREVEESAQVRLALETAGVRDAEPSARTALAEQLADNLRDQESALAVDNFPTFATLAQQFHRAFVGLNGNSLMLDIYDRIQDRQQLSIVRSAPRITDEPARVLAEHRELVRLAADADWVGFSTALGHHQQRSNSV